MRCTKYKIKECCGGSSTSLKLDGSISSDMIAHFCNYGFKESGHFTKNGILYLQNENVVLSGAIGSNTISVKCKSNNCLEYLNEIEKILENIT